MKEEESFRTPTMTKQLVHLRVPTFTSPPQKAEASLCSRPQVHPRKDP